MIPRDGRLTERHRPCIRPGGHGTGTGAPCRRPDHRRPAAARRLHGHGQPLRPRDGARRHPALGVRRDHGAAGPGRDPAGGPAPGHAEPHPFGLVLLGDLIYVVVALSITDAALYATPLMLLFASFVAAWFLGRWQFVTNLVVTPIACLVAMWGSYQTPAGLVVQVVVSAGMLDA